MSKPKIFDYDIVADMEGSEVSELKNNQVKIEFENSYLILTVTNEGLEIMRISHMGNSRVVSESVAGNVILIKP